MGGVAASLAQFQQSAAQQDWLAEAVGGMCTLCPSSFQTCRSAYLLTLVHGAFYV